MFEAEDVPVGSVAQPAVFGYTVPPMPGPRKMMLLCFGLFLIALMTLMKTTPLRSLCCFASKLARRKAGFLGY